MLKNLRLKKIYMKKRKNINWDKDPILDLVGIAPGPSDASENHDKYIYEREKRFVAVKRI